jgi:hypothetical protein
MAITIGSGITISSGIEIDPPAGSGGGGSSTPIAADSIYEFSNFPSGALLGVITTNSTLINYVTGLSVGATVRFEVISSTQGTYAGTGTIYSPGASYNAGFSRLGIPLDPEGFTWDAGSQVLGTWGSVNKNNVTSVTITVVS